MLPRRPTQDSKKPLSLPGCMGLTAVGLVGFVLLLWAMGALLVHSDPLLKVDALVVLSGNNDRIAQASRLKKEGYAFWVILTQAGETSPDMDARKLDVPGEMLLIAPGQVTSTFQEAETVRQVMLQRRLTSCIVVTDPYHTQRARMIFRDVLEPEGIRVWVYPVQDHWYRATTWWLRTEGIQVTLQEYVKMLAYLLGSHLN